jgi:hypothetical protein
VRVIAETTKLLDEGRQDRHQEGGKGTRPEVAKFQVRPGTLAK